MKFIVDELPSCCYHCICSSLHNTRPECNFIGTLNREDWKIKRDKNCPLIGIVEKNNSSSQKLSPEQVFSV